MRSIDIILNDKTFHGKLSEVDSAIEISVINEDDKEFFQKWIWERRTHPKKDIIRKVFFKNLGIFKENGILYGCQPIEADEDNIICILFDYWKEN